MHTIYLSILSLNIHYNKINLGIVFADKFDIHYRYWIAPIIALQNVYDIKPSVIKKVHDIISNLDLIKSNTALTGNQMLTNIVNNNYYDIIIQWSPIFKASVHEPDTYFDQFAEQLGIGNDIR